VNPRTALVIGAGALAILFIWSRAKGTTLPTSKTSATTSNLLTLGGGLLGGAGAALLVSPGASSGTSTNTSASSLASQNTADYSQASNYIADTTAASDTSSGVVGFGGWDDDA